MFKVLRQRRCTRGCGCWFPEAGWPVVCLLCGVPLRLVSACSSRVWVSSAAFLMLTAGRGNPDIVVSCIQGNYLHRRYLAPRDRANLWPRSRHSDFRPLRTKGDDGGRKRRRWQVNHVFMSWRFGQPDFLDLESRSR